MERRRSAAARSVGIAVVGLVLAASALADAEHPIPYPFGSPGIESEAARTIAIQAADLRFSPERLAVRFGETVKFVVTNTGKVRHEFVIGDRASQRAHERMMQKMPGMKHGDEPQALALEPGQTKTLVWKFDKQPSAPLEIACHEPGHYQAGMKIEVDWMNSPAGPLP